MLRAFFASATGMRAQEMLIDNTANNLANVNTTGFKRSNLDFADLMYATHSAPGGEIFTGQPSPIGLQIGSGARAKGTTKLFTPGVLQETRNPTDLAIEGDGFFKVLLPNGDERYTRDGSFQRDPNGALVTADGIPLADPVTIPLDAKNITIGLDGTVSVEQNGATAAVGQIQLYRFANPAGLSSEGNNLYAANAASGAELVGTPQTPGFGSIRQGFLELSNVEVVSELVSLITAQRAYEINARAIRAGDEMLSNTSQIVR